MIRKYVLPLLAVGLLFFAIFQVIGAQQEQPRQEPPITPARSPFGQGLAGAGIVEPQTENILIGSPLPGIVSRVAVEVGQQVKAGDLLFALDDREYRARLQVQQANLEAAQAQLARLEQMPRPEELPPSEARVREAQAKLREEADLARRSRVLFGNRAIGEEELVKREQAYRMAQEALARAQAEFHLLQAGAWQADKAVARAAVEQARAEVEQVQTDLERLQVRAPVDGEVLQVKVRPGEFVGAPSSRDLIVLGNVHQLHVRVDIDEHDIPRFRKGAPARAMLRGDPSQEFGLSFVRVEPYVVPKKSLTGENTERVDIRVLQVIYAFNDSHLPIYVGQQLDVFIDAAAASPGEKLAQNR